MQPKEWQLEIAIYNILGKQFQLFQIVPTLFHTSETLFVVEKFLLKKTQRFCIS